MSLVMRGIDFGPIFVSSGTLNFFGDGWPYHRLYKALFGKSFDFEGATFIAKTTTLKPRRGNMPLNLSLMPREWKPKCIKVDFSKEIMLNAVGLSGPGAENLLRAGLWQKRTDRFLISFMSLGDSLGEQVLEAESFVDLLLYHLRRFRGNVALQVNGSCPNTEHSTKEAFYSSLAILKPFQALGIPIDYKIGIADALESDIDAIVEIENSGLCDCLTCSNTVPWGKLPQLIDWFDLFGTKESPLKEYGGGGLSGRPLFNIVYEWLREVRAAGIKMPIKAGGGILRPEDALHLLRNGADAVEIGCVSTLRPFRVAKIISKVLEYEKGENNEQNIQVSSS